MVFLFAALGVFVSLLLASSDEIEEAELLLLLESLSVPEDEDELLPSVWPFVFFARCSTRKLAADLT